LGRFNKFTKKEINISSIVDVEKYSDAISSSLGFKYENK
jgi:hypothetical protein